MSLTVRCSNASASAFFTADAAARAAASGPGSTRLHTVDIETRMHVIHHSSCTASGQCCHLALSTLVECQLDQHQQQKLRTQQGGKVQLQPVCAHA